MNEEVKKILQKDKLRNINLLYFIENYGILKSEIISDSVMIHGKSDREWIMFSCTSEEMLESLLAKLDPKFKCFAFLEGWMLPVISKDRIIKWKLSTVQYMLPGEIDYSSNYNYLPSLSSEDSHQIMMHSEYKNYLSEGYIKERIMNGPSAGIYKDGKLIAWIHTHDDSAIGSLHVMPEERGLGLGKKLVIDMIHKIRCENKIPFTYIEPENVISTSLVLKLGFIQQKQINWIEFE